MSCECWCFYMEYTELLGKASLLGWALPSSSQCLVTVGKLFLNWPPQHKSPCCLHREPHLHTPWFSTEMWSYQPATAGSSRPTTPWWHLSGFYHGVTSPKNLCLFPKSVPSPGSTWVTSQTIHLSHWVPLHLLAQLFSEEALKRVSCLGHGPLFCQAVELLLRWHHACFIWVASVTS